MVRRKFVSPRDPIWLGPVQALRTLPKSLSVCTSSLLGAEGPVSLVSSITTSSYTEFPELLGKAFDGETPIRTKFPQVSYSLHNVQLYLSLSTARSFCDDG